MAPGAPSCVPVLRVSSPGSHWSRPVKNAPWSPRIRYAPRRPSLTGASFIASVNAVAMVFRSTNTLRQNLRAKSSDAPKATVLLVPMTVLAPRSMSAFANAESQFVASALSLQVLHPLRKTTVPARPWRGVSSRICCAVTRYDPMSGQRESSCQKYSSLGLACAPTCHAVMAVPCLRYGHTTAVSIPRPW